MTAINDLLLNTTRQQWREVPANFSNTTSVPISRVSLYENSAMVRIFRCEVDFRVEDTPGALFFDKPDDAEVFAAARLSGRNERAVGAEVTFNG